MIQLKAHCGNRSKRESSWHVLWQRARSAHCACLQSASINHSSKYDSSIGRIAFYHIWSYLCPSVCVSMLVTLDLLPPGKASPSIKLYHGLQRPCIGTVFENRVDLAQYSIPFVSMANWGVWNPSFLRSSRSSLGDRGEASVEKAWASFKEGQGDKLHLNNVIINIV